MDTDSITSADAKEAETSSQSKHLESKNKGIGVKSSSLIPGNYTNSIAKQQNVSRSSETPEGLDMNDVHSGQTISSPGKDKFSW